MMAGQDLIDPFWVTVFLGIITVLFLYWYSTRNFDYWKKRGIPYVKPTVPFFGSTFSALYKPFHEIELERYRKYGPLYGHFEGNRPALSVADLKLIREVVVKEFSSFADRRDFLSGNVIVDSMLFSLRGEHWKRVRSIVSPTFTTGKIRRMVSIIKECSQTLVDNFKKVSRSGRPFQAKEFYGAFSIDVIASSAFSTKLDSHNDPKNRFVQSAKIAFSSDFSFRFAIHQLFPRLAKMLGIPVISPEPMKFFKDVTLQIIDQRKKTGQTRNDFLQLLMDTAKEVSQEQKWENDKDGITSNYGQDESSHQTGKNVSNKNLTLDELVGQCVIFFLAGYDTTASTLSYASYLLALHPEIQAQLYDELRDVLQKTNGELTYEALQEMKYLDNVISESMRIYPAVTRLERMTVADCKLGDTGVTVPKDMIVTIPIYALQRDPKLFPDPEKFDPNRFTPEERAKRDPYAFMPFGAGPRNCVGMRFALMEVKVCLAYVIANFKLLRCLETKVPLQFHLGPGLLITKNLALKLEERTDKILLK
ncbi:cytochrome P450 3A31-like [Argiope bruennichi]|uniref:Cytochrome P450 3A11 like protein n=1 Tax=Argiope bruennichi TaxID=94029 RepID=A0A8T0FFY5_ARGBR|nr:cytochrome P450 3A31-like [Argiope bruennichi]KAF8787803.1 Cytochrome P450 3A11 like protein [Argiope bruennichi]